VGMRYIMRWNDLQIKIREKKLKSAEAEVRWLKYQLNPHFLFNTLNNISSLTQIDADKAQENIGQLSDLLRYAIYDSNQQRVELEGEVEFMNNYISLMRLRCNEMTTIENDMKLPGKPVKIAPLLFISLIENAFKHGVNSRRESFVRIRLELVGNDLVFTCENSYFSNNSLNRIGSGIGLENMKRRLELLYHDNYEYISVIKDETYTAKVTIRNIT
ncbi:MAG: histidine kinase, partial [Bacteroidales bacterium]|nr:histidine kinase [Bacteroidales bacterium]